MYDSHIHIGLLPHPEEIALELQRKNVHYTHIACDPDKWDAEVNLWNKTPEGNNMALGVHPMIAEKWDKIAANKLQLFLEQHPSFQVGEIGLDKRYPGYEPGGIQESAFLNQLQIAKELNRDYQIHCVGDYGRIVQCIKRVGGSGIVSSAPIFHRFGGDSTTVRIGLEMGAKFSLHPSSFQKKSTLAAMHLIPKENMLFETDADDSFFDSMNTGRTTATNRTATAPHSPVATMVAEKIETLLRDIRKRAENI